MINIVLKRQQEKLKKHRAQQLGADTNQPEPELQPIDFVAVEGALQADIKALSNIKDVKDKLEVKKTHLLPKYSATVNAYIDSGARYPNPVLFYCAMWAIDIGDIETGLTYASVAIEQQQIAPSHFSRDCPTFFAEQIADYAVSKIDKETVSLDQIETVTLEQIESIADNLATNKWPVTEPIVRGKVFKVAGMYAELSGDLKKALAHFETAQKENEKAGCKNRIKQIKEKLNS